MDEQRPGQTFTPQNSQAPESIKAQTPSEISEIDAAMQSQPPSPLPTPPMKDSPAQPIEVPREPVLKTEAAPPVVASAVPEVRLDEEASGDSEISEEPILQWSASESAKDPAALLKAVFVLGGMGAVLLVGLIIVAGFGLGAVLGALAVLLGSISLYLTGRQHVASEDYALYSEGVTIGPTYYPFAELESFGLAYGDEYCIELVPVKRFMPRISMYLEPTSAEEVLSMLESVLPRDDKEPDLVDRLYKKLGI